LLLANGTQQRKEKQNSYLLQQLDPSFLNTLHNNSLHTKQFEQIAASLFSSCCCCYCIDIQQLPNSKHQANIRFISQAATTTSSSSSALIGILSC
jgi:hypothetical protein